MSVNLSFRIFKLRNAMFVEMVQANEVLANRWGNYDSYQSNKISCVLISDVHERSYEVLTVPNYFSENQLLWKWAQYSQGGKQTLHFGLVLYSFI